MIRVCWCFQPIGSFVGWIGKIFGTLLLMMITTGAILAVFFSMYVAKNLQVDLDVSLEDITLDQASLIYYTDPDTGQSVHFETVYGKENREMARYSSKDPGQSEIPEYMAKALVAIEDKRFFEHKGVDWKRTLFAFGNMFLQMRDEQGGSTITQQLIKNLTDDKEVTVQRKVQEILRAQEFEKNYGKDKILEAYLNTSYFGEGCYGVKTAARTYFDKDVKDLTLAESASIIGITNSPTRYNPYLNPDNNIKRRNDILKAMFEQGMIPETVYNQAKNETLSLKRYQRPSEKEVQSYFVDQVINDVVADLISQKGYSKQMAQQLIYTGGLQIHTTLNPKIQAILDEEFADDANFDLIKNTEPPQSACIILDRETGQIVAVIGGRGAKEGNLVLNRATQAKRQPGSAIKPVAVYAPALDDNLITPYSVITDAPLSRNGKAWPKNSTNKGIYAGQMTVEQALRLSTNTVAVRVLEKITPLRAFTVAKETMHLSTLVEEKTVGQKVYSDITLSLALGGLTDGVTLRDLAAAYNIFPNAGQYNKPVTYTQVYDAKGRLLLDNSPSPTAALKEKTAWYINNLLQGVVRSGTGTAARLDGMPVAGKTGTTTENYDRWFAGYTPYYTAVFWVGYDYPKELKGSVNPTVALWKAVMSRVHEGLEEKQFFTLENTVSASYCLDSGLKPTEACQHDPRGSRVAKGTFYKDDVPRETCHVHTYLDVDSVSGQLATPYCPAADSIKVAYLNLIRPMPTAGVTVYDEGYVVRYYDTPLAYPSGTYAPAIPSDPKYMLNAFCTLHTDTPPAETDPLNPDNPDNLDPLDPALPPEETVPPVNMSPPPSVSPVP